MKVSELLENEYENEPIPERDIVGQVIFYRDQIASLGTELQLLSNKLNVLWDKGIIAPDQRSGDYVELPSTELASGSWWIENTPENQKVLDYIKKITARGRTLSEKRHDYKVKLNDIMKVVAKQITDGKGGGDK